MGIRLTEISTILKPLFFKDTLNDTFVDNFQAVLDSYCDFLQDNGELDPDETCSDKWVKYLKKIHKYKDIVLNWRSLF